MKKTAKPLILVIILTFVMITLLVLAYVGIKLGCEVLAKEKVLAEEKLNFKKNWKVNLIAQYQNLTSKERIIDIAANQLGMIERTESSFILNVDKEKIGQIEKVIGEKYE